jgi:hypothetical protein
MVGRYELMLLNDVSLPSFFRQLATKVLLNSALLMIRADACNWHEVKRINNLSFKWGTHSDNDSKVRYGFFFLFLGGL